MLCVAGRVVVEHHGAIAPADLRAGRLGPASVAGCESSPAADADHLVELGPAGKRVVRRVQHHESAAVLHVVDECLLHRRRELETLVVQHDRLVVGERWRETRHVLVRRRALRRRRRHGDGKAPAVFQLTLDDRTADFPVVIPVALPGDEQDFDARLRGRGHDAACGERQRCDKQNGISDHVIELLQNPSAFLTASLAIGRTPSRLSRHLSMYCNGRSRCTLASASTGSPADPPPAPAGCGLGPTGPHAAVITSATAHPNRVPTITWSPGAPRCTSAAAG